MRPGAKGMGDKMREGLGRLLVEKNSKL